jgi:hypothetical protein
VRQIRVLSVGYLIDIPGFPQHNSLLLQFGDNAHDTFAQIFGIGKDRDRVAIAFAYTG